MTARFDRFDLGLFALGLLGLVPFAALLPGQHPDSAASYDLGRERAVALAREMLERKGYATDDLTPHARLTRAARLLDSLQHDDMTMLVVRIGEDGRMGEDGTNHCDVAARSLDASITPAAR